MYNKYFNCLCFSFLRKENIIQLIGSCTLSFTLLNFCFQVSELRLTSFRFLKARMARMTINFVQSLIYRI